MTKSYILGVWSLATFLIVSLTLVACRRDSYDCINGNCEAVRGGDYRSRADCMLICESSNNGNTGGASGGSGGSVGSGGSGPGSGNNKGGNGGSGIVVIRFQL